VAGKKAVKHSPLVRSAMEVLEHGLWHFFRSQTTTDMKFAILHLDQAVELLLKERIRKAGYSIHKPNNTKETIGIWVAYDILEKQVQCRIPERSDLEFLHEERNNIQHKYANPTAEDAAFYVEKAFGFIERFARDELDIELGDFISSEYLERLIGGAGAARESGKD
jgi:hypothetical protein